MAISGMISRKVADHILEVLRRLNVAQSRRPSVIVRNLPSLATPRNLFRGREADS
jgi:hypothetical protein